MPMQMPRLFPEDRPVLGGARIVSLVVYARDAAASRRFYEEVLGLPLIADDGRSVRLDAGTTVLEIRSGTGGEGGPRLALTADDPEGLPGEDPDGNRLSVVQSRDRGLGVGPRGVSVAEVTLPVRDVEEAAALFEGALELRALQRSGEGARYDAGGVVLATVPAEGPSSAGIAPVFYVEDLGDSVWRLARRGTRLAHTVSYTRAGGTARVDAPSGHLLWLWEPSDEARDGPGGRKLEQLLAGV